MIRSENAGRQFKKTPADIEGGRENSGLPAAAGCLWAEGRGHASEAQLSLEGHFRTEFYYPKIKIPVIFGRVAVA